MTESWDLENPEAEGRAMRVGGGVCMEGKGNDGEEETRSDRVGRVEMGKERKLGGF